MCKASQVAKRRPNRGGTYLKLRVKLICNQLFKKAYEPSYVKGVWRDKDTTRWGFSSIRGRDTRRIDFSYPNLIQVSFPFDFSDGITTSNYTFLKKAYVHFDLIKEDISLRELTWLFLDFKEIEFPDDLGGVGDQNIISLLCKEAQKFDQWLCEVHGKPERLPWTIKEYYEEDRAPAFRIYLFECSETPGNWLFSLPEGEAIQYLRKLRRVLGMEEFVAQPTILGKVICDASPEEEPPPFPWDGISMFTPNLGNDPDEEFCHLPVALLSIKGLWVSHTALSKVDKELDGLPFLRTDGYKDMLPFQIKHVKDLMKRGGRRIASLYADYLERQLDLDENLIKLNLDFQKHIEAMERISEVVFLPGTKGCYIVKESPFRAIWPQRLELE